ncbi:MAG: AIR carboxylase family protein [Polyangiales bacterium]
MNCALRRDRRVAGPRRSSSAAGGARTCPGWWPPDRAARARGPRIPGHGAQSVDALLSIVQMPRGVPVGTLAVSKPGAANAALLAARIPGHHPRPALRASRPGRTRGGTSPGAHRLLTHGAYSPRRDAGHPRRRAAQVRRPRWPRAPSATTSTLDPDPSCAARFVVERCLTVAFDDDFAAADLATRHCAVARSPARDRVRSRWPRSTPRAGMPRCVPAVMCWR